MSNLLKRANALNEHLARTGPPSSKARQVAKEIKKLLDQAVKANDPSILDRLDTNMRDLRRELQGGSSIDYTIG